MRGIWTVALLILLLLSGAVLADEDGPADLRQRRKEAEAKIAAEERALQRRVDAAIDRGTTWLAERQESSGGWVVERSNNWTHLGEQALILLALAKCGVAARDVVMKRGIERLDALYSEFPRDVAPGWSHIRTYTTSVLVLFYDALYGKAPKARRPGRSYARGANPCRYPRDVRKRIKSLISWLVRAQDGGGWRYPDSPWPGTEDPRQDLSHTQYALLALQVAARCGIDVPPRVYRTAGEYVMGLQPEDGPTVPYWSENPAWTPGIERYPRFVEITTTRARGFPYIPRGGITGSMTVAGLSSLAIVKDRLREANALDADLLRRIDRSIVDGIAWLSSNFSLTNPGHEQKHWIYYYLYGLERAGVLLGQRFIGTHDWYSEGAELLLTLQEEDGRWPRQTDIHHHGPVVQTCFALLFLKRATYAPRVPLAPVVTGG